MSQGFSKATKAMCKAGLTKESMRMRQLKREHAMMKRWLPTFIWAYRDPKRLIATNVFDEIRAKMPRLFAEKVLK